MKIPTELFVLLFVLALSPLSAAQEVSGTTSLPDPPAGNGLAPRPFFLPDPNFGGQAGELHLLDMAYGRLVDVHALDAQGRIEPVPAFKDFVINENVASDGADYFLFESITGEIERLVILRQVDAPDFRALLRQAEADLAPVLPRALLGPPPFSAVARNAALVLRFDDLLQDDLLAEQSLPEHVKLLVDTIAFVPFESRMIFDRNHGGVRGGQFHATRIIVDLDVSELDAASSPGPVPVNPFGLPASEPTSAAPNVLFRLPTLTSPSDGQFTILTNLAGNGLATSGNGPVDLGSPTRDLVRAMRSGNELDPFLGHLVDVRAPRVVGRFPVLLEDVRADSEGPSGNVFRVDLAFQSICASSPVAGEALSTAAGMLEVLENAGPLDLTGRVSDVRVTLSGGGTTVPAALAGFGLHVRPYAAASPLEPACWTSVAPAPGVPLTGAVDPSARFQTSFSEAVAPESVRVYDAVRVIEGLGPAGAENLVPGDALVFDTGDGVSFLPVLPLSHTLGSAEPFRYELTGTVTDPAGNPLADVPPSVVFTLDPSAATETSDGVVLRFASEDEVGLSGAPDIRGQVSLDLVNGTLVPPPVAFRSFPVDRNNPVPSLMLPLPGGVQTPLVPLGSKLQTVWRYVDAGLSVGDESTHNLDVIGLSWAPEVGVISDFFAEFEMRLAHSTRQPDEEIQPLNLLPMFAESGLLGAPSLFEENVLNDPLGSQAIVHPRSLGYVIDPADQFVSGTGTTLMPFPMNRAGGPLLSFTWRDTAILSEAAPDGAGVPLAREVGAPLFLEPEAGEVAPPGEVPTIGLPLLLEFRTFPSATAIGLNSLAASLALNSSARPSFRVHSTGGFNTAGTPVFVNPDVAPVPTGGFNPSSSPPGLPTLDGDPVSMLGQIDTVSRIGRAVSVWLDTESAAPDYVVARLDDESPIGTAVVLEFRGADGFSVDAGDGPFDANQLDVYGDLFAGTVDFHGGINAWTGDLNAVDGARYLQLRLTFVNDLDTSASALLHSVSVAFR